MAKCTRCGKGGIFQKMYSDGMCAECYAADLQTKYDNLKRSVTPVTQGIVDLNFRMEQLSAEIAEKEAIKNNIQSEIQQAEIYLEKLNKNLIVAQEASELESFSLYIPRYNFVSSEEYKYQLDAIRDQQKEMIKNGTAATCKTEWTVNGSKAEGRKQTADNIKLFLRSFNNECEAAVSGAKFNNYEKCEMRIRKSFETINKLGRTTNISLSTKYLKLKLAELQLAYEYARKKQDEKEEQAEIRRQQREQAKLEKEIADARKAAEKERQHYEQALSKLNAQLLACQDDDMRKDLEAKKTELQSNIDTIQDKLEDIDYRQNNQRAGYVYIISNLGAFGENVYKIGMTRRLNPMDRIDELGDASVPFDFDVHAMIFTPDAPALEAALHHAFESKRINKINRRREYFNVTLDEIKAVVQANHDKTVEFVEAYTAEQYRESLKMS